MQQVRQNMFRLVVAVGAMLAMAASARGAEMPGFTQIGTLGVRPAREIAASTWSIGGETLDRDYAVYANYRKYLGPLGAKAIRLQAGWAKCEKQPGVYDWAWLDEIVDDARAQGVQPWLQTSYGNPIYPGGGNVSLGAGLPSSPEALVAWDRWVQALARHYRDRVTQWEIWNEPDLGMLHAGLGERISGVQYADFFVRTAEILRSEQPQAEIYGLALAGRFDFAEQFLVRLKELKKTDLLTAVTVHGYPFADPEDLTTVTAVRKLLAAHAPAATVRQGETGSPSEGKIANQQWSEIKQAKWDLRRMLAHHGADVPFSLFALSDMKYPAVNSAFRGFNRKGILLCNDDKTVARPKLAYYAAQRGFALFDSSLERIQDFCFEAEDQKLVAYGYRKQGSPAAVVTAWRRAGPPSDEDAAQPVPLAFAGVSFTRPAYVDLLSGNVYAIPPERWTTEGGKAVFRDLPLGDWPIVIAEQSALLVENVQNPAPLEP